MQGASDFAACPPPDKAQRGVPAITSQPPLLYILGRPYLPNILYRKIQKGYTVLCSNEQPASWSDRWAAPVDLASVVIF